MLDDGLLAAARDRLWAGNTSATLRRADPATWAAGFGEGDRRSDASGLNDRSAERGPKQPARCYGHVVSQVRRQSPFPQWRQSFEFELHGGGINDVRED